MPQHAFFKKTGYLGLILLLGLCLGAAKKGAENPTDTGPGNSVHRPGPTSSPVFGPDAVVDFKRAQALLASYEKALPRAKASRGLVLTELSRLCFILGEWGDDNHRKQYFKKGVHYAKLLRREQPRRVEGYYWLALNLGGLAEMSGAWQGLHLVSVIVKDMKIAARLDPGYNQAGPDRVLGRIYFKAPAWPLSVGNLHKSLRYLRAAVKLAPNNSTNHLYLAETLLQLGKSSQACRELEKAFRATSHAHWAPDLKKDHQKAHHLLQVCPTGPVK